MAWSAVRASWTSRTKRRGALGARANHQSNRGAPNHHEPRSAAYMACPDHVSAPVKHEPCQTSGIRLDCIDGHVPAGVFAQTKALTQPSSITADMRVLLLASLARSCQIVVC